MHEEELGFNKNTYDYRTKDKLRLLVEEDEQEAVRAGDGNEELFEVFRRIVREESPVTESTEYGLRFGFQQMVYCNSMEDTRKLIQAMEQNISE